MKKIFIRVAVVLAALALIAVISMALFLDSIVKKGIETAGPQVMKAPVTVEGVSLSVFSGKGKVTGLTVGNPEGFHTFSAIKCGTATVQVRPSTIMSGKLVIQSVRIEAPEITLEAGLKGSNLGALLANLGSYSASQSQAKPGEKSSSRKLQVDDFAIIGGKVNLSLTVMVGKAASVPLPDIHLTNLGTGPDGITTAELTEKVVKEIVESATKAAGGIAGKTAENLGGAVKDAGNSLDKAAKDLGNLFKK